ncbi:Enamine deaminase RidA, house cleaning of reactive enamine intermediates, YjgF/YER057c/UK114 family [Micromonospora haikouensis]|uniref:Enamine deaminase RidA, house cleaning of reactive enamine intermediates, YjgF/YER057c/UK114 family n=1 Tax=Micromonospora haikouensis TaxID=686309 RepID=A0A1C4XDL9_9ACTN|nr:RidA family protein [Micromonospora haikouensis]SCF06566.1 Enamine deaminase RidA, house cleaning of reactive enamine intermediates, YjgF/YER057c/UK114 family [Micromonospora haikouensis]
MTSQKTVLLPEGHSKPIGRYSPGIRVAASSGAGLVFISGQVATDDHGNVLSPENAREQARVVFGRIEQVLAAAGGSLADLVSVTIYLTDVRRDFPAVSAVRNEVLADPPPASVLVEVAALAETGCVVEISGIAIVEGES